MINIPKRIGYAIGIRLFLRESKTERRNRIKTKKIDKLRSKIAELEMENT